MKIRATFLICVFCGFLALTAAGYIFLPKAAFSPNEKKMLAEGPALSLDTLADGSFAAKAEEWFEDHVPAREALVGINAGSLMLLGQNGLNGVIRAGDRLVGAPEELNADALRAACAKISAFAEKTGLPTAVMPVPEAGYMLSELLPNLHYAYHDAEAIDILRASLDAGTEYIDASEALAAFGERAYYRTDHHLTSAGCYALAGLYAEALGRTMPDSGKYIRAVYPGFYGSMYSRSGLWNTHPDEIELWSSGLDVTVTLEGTQTHDGVFYLSHLKEMDKYPVFLDGNHGLVTIDTGRTGGETLLLVRDSFGHCFGPFMAELFDRVILVDLRYYHSSVSALAEREGVDRVLFLMGMDTLMAGGSFSFLR